jgi:hypothetical protein
MNIIEPVPGMLRGRVFTLITEPAFIAECLDRDAPIDSEDEPRYALTRELLTQHVIKVRVHEDEENDDVKHLYLIGSEHPLFAFVMMSATRVEICLAETPETVMVEDYCFQVGPDTSPPSILAALEAWVVRCFKMIPPRFEITRWVANA